ncbi:TetR/AcrR family transcriptional regulator [Streptomyces sp. NPDC047315]|uniref:TetR/AcrR family transcriptional regulator n=1 Tax=Streptomyces sp. NPDC047315 TaxID=3155142 RepID=UPI0033F66BCB
MARRPPNRKVLIRATAAELFREHGYHNVSVTDVADALGFTPSALYHHYRSKQDLLFHTILDSLDVVDTPIREAGDLDEALRSLATLVASPERLLAVWERQSRYLDDTQREAVRAREVKVVADLALLLRAARPDLTEADGELTARAALGVLGSPLKRRLRLSRRRHEQLILRLASAVASCEFSSVPGPDSPAVPVGPPSPPVPGLRVPRRDQLLNEAIRLFDERGYQTVTMADIGEATGIVASGVYRHFPGKTDLLVAATNRGGECLRAGAERALALGGDPRGALDLLLRSYISVAVENLHLIGILTAERDQLPDKERIALRRFQAAYLDMWLQALDAATPGRDATELRAAVQATYAMIHFVARASRQEPWPDVQGRLAELGTAVLLGP